MTLFLCCLSLLFAMLASNLSGFDLWLEGQFYDVHQHIFLLRDNPWLTLWMHDGFKKLATLIWVGLASVTAWGAWSVRSGSGRAGKLQVRILLYVVVASGVSAIVVGLLKHFSEHSCPWDLIQFGGNGRFFSLLEHRPELLDGQSAAGPGKCFPSGHASTGWMWIGVLFALRQLPVNAINSRVRSTLVGLVMSAGFVSSAIQIVRGAHFLSHVLATALLCLVLSWAIEQFMFHRMMFHRERYRGI